MVQPLWNTVWQLFRMLNITSPYELATLLTGIHSREMKTRVRIRVLKRSAVTHDGSKEDTIQMSISWWIDGWKVVYSQNGLSSGTQRSEEPICDDTGEPWNDRAEWNEPVAADCTRCDSVCLRSPEHRAIQRDREKASGGWGLGTDSHGFLSWC